MRISDWSSDVCSSDLAFLIAVRGSIVALQLDQRGDLESQLLDLAFQDFELLRLRIENLVAGGAIGDERLGIDRKSVVKGTSVSVRVDLGGRGSIKEKKSRTD